MLVRAAVIAVLSLSAAVLIIRHYAGDLGVAQRSVLPFMQVDGTGATLDEARKALLASPPNTAEAIMAAQAALALSPLNIYAMKLLAGGLATAGDAASAETILKEVLARSKRDRDVLTWAYGRAAAAHDWTTFIDAVDALVRVDPGASEQQNALGLLVSMTADPDARKTLMSRLDDKPAWGPDFLQKLAKDADIDVAAAVLTKMMEDDRADALPAWNAFLNRLVRSDRAQQAYALWAGVLDPEQLAGLQYLFNGGFEQTPGGSPFDWTLSTLTGAQRSIVSNEAADGASSLSLTFVGAEVESRHAWQTLLLSPGSYRLTGKVKMLDLKTSRGLLWTVYCRKGTDVAMLGRSPFFMGTEPWTDFDFNFTVPAENCDSQLVSLELPARIAAERKISGRIWFDDLAITSAP
jgi:hypothetical protein